MPEEQKKDGLDPRVNPLVPALLEMQKAVRHEYAGQLKEFEDPEHPEKGLILPGSPKARKFEALRREMADEVLFRLSEWHPSEPIDSPERLWKYIRAKLLLRELATQRCLPQPYQAKELREAIKRIKAGDQQVEGYLATLGVTLEQIYATAYDLALHMCANHPELPCLPVRESDSEKGLDGLRRWCVRPERIDNGRQEDLSALVTQLQAVLRDVATDRLQQEEKQRTAPRPSEELNMEVREYLHHHATATARKVASDVGCSPSTVVKTPAWKAVREGWNRETTEYLNEHPQATLKDVSEATGLPPHITQTLPIWKSCRPKVITLSKKTQSMIGTTGETLEQLVKDQHRDDPRSGRIRHRRP